MSLIRVACFFLVESLMHLSAGADTVWIVGITPRPPPSGARGIRVRLKNGRNHRDICLASIGTRLSQSSRKVMVVSRNDRNRDTGSF